MENLMGDEARMARGQSTMSLPLHVTSPAIDRPRTRRIRRSRLDLGTEADVGPKEALGVGSDDREDEEAFISIGFDLGTTFSGIAWALSTSPEDIDIVAGWDSDMPGQKDLHKVPSVITYDSRGLVSSWGYKLDKRKHQLSWFKLGLSDLANARLEKEQPERFARLQTLLEMHHKTAIDVVADYIRCLWAHATEEIKKKLGKDLWNNMKLRIVLTVPAIWDHKAQELTKRAAQMASMLERADASLELIGEPEAAALSVFNEMNSQKVRGLQEGDIFVVCDAGGGTVDLISYKIEKIEPLRLAMVCEATGGLCGAIFLDAAFEKQIRTMISTDDYEDLGSRAKRKMMNDWELGIKRSFKIDEPENEKWHVDIPGYLGVHVPESETRESGPDSALPGGFAPHKHISDIRAKIHCLSNESLNRVDPGTLVLKTGHLNAIFSDVCSKIKHLVGTQLSVAEAREEKKAAAIFLVGGFGENIYLRQELERSFSHVEIQQPTKSWAAICRGAVLKGLGHDLVVNHISKYNYGCVYAPDFIKNKHLEEDRYWDEICCVWKADNQLRWFLNKGDNVEKEDPVTHRFFFPVTDLSRLKGLTTQIYYSDSLVAESRIEGSVKLLCTLKMNLNPSIFEELPVYINEKGVEWRRFDYILEMQVSSGEICWSVKYKDIEAGAVKTVVGYEGMANV